jgi:hypothetical protein
MTVSRTVTSHLRRRVVDDDGAAAGGAGGVGEQPGVDARDVEPVSALRHHAHLLPLAELCQADGALRQHLLRLIPPVLLVLVGSPCRGGRDHRVRVRQLRKRLERPLLQPLDSGSGGGSRYAGPRRAATMLVSASAAEEPRVGRWAARRG